MGRFWRSDVITSRDSIIELKNEQIDSVRRKLEGTAQDEYRQQIEALERRLQELDDPRLFNPETMSALEKSLEGASGRIRITRNVGDAGTAGVQMQFKRLFQRLGWNVESYAAMGIDNPPPCGLAIFGSATVAVEQDEVTKALDAAAIKYETRTHTIPSDPLQLVFVDID